MKVLTVTEKNFNFIAGRLMKFFNHKNFVSWYQLSGGVKKRISTTINREDMTCHYSNVKFEVGEDLFTGNPVMVYYLSHNDTGSIIIGDKVAFLGNSVIIRTRYNSYIDEIDLIFCNKVAIDKYLYECFQIE